MRRRWITRHRRRLLPLAALALAWGGGQIAFGWLIDRYDPQPPEPGEAIVVFTGGLARLDTALRLLEERQAPHLFVSGVARGIEIADLIAVAQNSPQWLKCCITISARADNTMANARETAHWLDGRGHTAITLVTSAYHMPRSLLALRAFAPHLEVRPMAVYSRAFPRGRADRSLAGWLIIAGEYNKFLLTAAIAGPLWLIRRLTPDAAP